MAQNASNKVVLTVILLAIVCVAVSLTYKWLFIKSKTSLPTYNVVQNVSPTPLEKEGNLNEQIISDLVAGGINCDLKDENGKLVKNSCSVDKVEGNYAKGTMPMAYWIAQKTNGKWSSVITGNGIPQCSGIDKYSVPKEIFGNCIEASGELRY